MGGFQVVDTTQVNTYTGFTCQDSTACAANPSLNCSAIARTAVDTNFAWVDDECHDFTALGGGFVPIECTWSQLSCL